MAGASIVFFELCFQQLSSIWCIRTKNFSLTNIQDNLKFFKFICFSKGWLPFISTILISASQLEILITKNKKTGKAESL